MDSVQISRCPNSSCSYTKLIPPQQPKCPQLTHLCTCSIYFACETFLCNQVALVQQKIDLLISSSFSARLEASLTRIKAQSLCCNYLFKVCEFCEFVNLSVLREMSMSLTSVIAQIVEVASEGGGTLDSESMGSCMTIQSNVSVSVHKSIRYKCYIQKSTSLLISMHIYSLIYHMHTYVYTSIHAFTPACVTITPVQIRQE